jgi:hypothetical protein
MFWADLINSLVVLVFLEVMKCIPVMAQ